MSFLPKHVTIWVVAERLLLYLWLEMQWKRVADELCHVEHASEGAERVGHLLQSIVATRWSGQLSLPCTSQRTCNEKVYVCCPPSCCKSSEKPSAIHKELKPTRLALRLRWPHWQLNTSSSLLQRWKGLQRSGKTMGLNNAIKGLLQRSSRRYIIQYCMA